MSSSQKKVSKVHTLSILYNSLNSEIQKYLETEYQKLGQILGERYLKNSEFQIFKLITKPNGSLNYQSIKGLKKPDSLFNFLFNLDKYNLNQARYSFSEIFTEGSSIVNIESVELFNEVLNLIIKILKEDLLVIHELNKFPLLEFPNYLFQKKIFMFNEPSLGMKIYFELGNEETRLKIGSI